MNPTRDKVLVKVREEKNPKKGEEAQAAIGVMTADVKAVGPEVMEIEKGDVVVFAPYGIDEVMVGKEKMLIVQEELILATHERKK